MWRNTLMERYDLKILNSLLDSYENSLLSRGENKVQIHISFPFTKKMLPEYFNESSSIYDEIHELMRELERKRFLSIVWKNGNKGHIIQKVLLNVENIEKVYSFLHRTAKSNLVQENLEFLAEWKSRCKENTIASQFLCYLLERLKTGKTVKEFIELSDLKRTKTILETLIFLEENTEPLYIREFSIQHFGDSKILEGLLGTIGKIIRRFQVEFEEMDISEILAEYGVYHTPDYVYVKGAGKIVVHNGAESILDLSPLEHGIGISGADMDKIQIVNENKVEKVITIENLTTFFRWKEEDSLIIYLGGYHNQVRRTLLSKIYENFPDAEYLHFGDIDVGGFRIYQDLCRKTGIPFQTYHMGIEELELYKEYTKKLTENDKKRLEFLMKDQEPELLKSMDVLEYMQKYHVKLEQEIVRL